MLTTVNSDVDGPTIFQTEIPILQGWSYSDVLFASSKNAKLENAGEKRSLISAPSMNPVWPSATMQETMKMVTKKNKKTKLRKRHRKYLRRKKNPTSSRRWCCFSPHATNLPLASLLLTIRSGCGIIGKLEIKRSGVRKQIGGAWANLPASVFLPGQGPAAWLIGLLEPEPSLGFTRT